MKSKGHFILAAIYALAAIILIILVSFVDVADIGPAGTSIGLSHINKFFFDLLGVNQIWYVITDWLGFVAILTALMFAVTGLIQLIRRKSLLKVDKELFCLGGLYIVVIGMYALFEFAVVNYRPVLMPGSSTPEASFPSSHTMLVCVIMGSAVILMDKYIKSRGLRTALKWVCWFIILLTLSGRLISGVHWFTDIIGGVLISTLLLSLFSGIIERIGDHEKNDCLLRA